MTYVAQRQARAVSHVQAARRREWGITLSLAILATIGPVIISGVS